MSRLVQVMVIDDDRDDLRLFEEAVRDFNVNYECVTFTNGVTALEFLKQQNFLLPDVIFLDLRMPKLNGRKVLWELKQDLKLRGIPVVILTTSTDVDESRELRQLGASHFCSKPSDPEELFYVVALSLEEALSN